MNKYFNKRNNGFDSKKEERRFKELEQLQNAGIISDLERQVKFVLIPAQREPDTVNEKGKTIKGKVIERECSYYADFVYYQEGQLVVEDVKSKYTRKLPEYIIKRKLLLKNYQIRIKEVD